MTRMIYADNWTSRNLVCSECGYPTLHRCETCDEGLCVECSDGDHPKCSSHARQGESK